jgi:predicted chitinase
VLAQRRWTPCRAHLFTAAARRFPDFNRTRQGLDPGQGRHGGCGLTRWGENLFYTSADQVKRMFGSRAGANPKRLLRNPKLLGDTVYAAMGGYDARGLGAIQLTGPANHRAFVADGHDARRRPNLHADDPRRDHDGALVSRSLRRDGEGERRLHEGRDGCRSREDRGGA